ncbi:hypothetical protein HYDPIDRAFT_28471 [Hydnomerulius pinastri MD-312]|uniref:Uncharacterized protein n=1 Tax=Hydnomerulius pinastri MD-312 TaxID=994086 RepID=A0A0C9W9P9_9AGAM|nr:hypothetical protein HYDPIDRAFT_28471 [Hydnomerulius pinastri MD-312]
MSFDEAIGLLAIGNIFGELAVVDFAGDITEAFGIVKSLPALGELSGDILSPSFSVHGPLTLDIVPVFHVPHNGGLAPHEDEAGLAIVSSKCFPLPDEDLPPGWSNDWGRYPLWARWEGYPGDRAFKLLHRHHHIGRPQLIMFNRRGSVLFRVGGMYMSLDLVDKPPVVYSHGVTLEDILGVLTGGGSLGLLPHRVCPVDDWTGDTLFGQWDEHISYDNDRNRWREMRDRGGFPPEAYVQAA